MKKKMKKLHRSNKGFTLMELVVTMLVSSIVVAAVAGFLSMGLNYYRRTNAETTLQTESQVSELFLTMESVTSGFSAIKRPSVSVKVRIWSLTRKLLLRT